jgi:chorismate mutase
LVSKEKYKSKHLPLPKISNGMSIQPISSWFKGKIESPLIIAGPCSAENRHQVVNTAIELAKLNKVHILRAGVWKPRSRPSSFQGAGDIALEWLVEAKEKTGLMLAVEVATPHHVELALKYGIDALWVGARTSSNPFSVDQLASSLSGVDIPVLVKNPINPDIELWIGILERFLRVGVSKLGAIHRGFSPFQRSIYRNLPKWEVPIDLKSYMPTLPVICDPSHIAGRPELIKGVAQKALDLSMDGLMIESHINPGVALSDAKQQITPEELSALLNDLIFRKLTPSPYDSIDILETLREKIDSLDQQLLELLSQRMDLVKTIGEYKRDNNVAIMQLRRWEEMISSRVDFGKSLGLADDYIKNLLRLVHKESIRKQAEILSRKNIPDAE